MQVRTKCTQDCALAEVMSFSLWKQPKPIWKMHGTLFSLPAAISVPMICPVIAYLQQLKELSEADRQKSSRHSGRICTHCRSVSCHCLWKASALQISLLGQYIFPEFLIPLSDKWAFIDNGHLQWIYKGWRKPSVNFFWFACAALCLG